MSLVFRTAVASLLVQFFVGGVTLASFFVPTSDAKRDDLRVILSLELASQAIEFAWYTVVVCRYLRIRTWTRYVDWILSTPIMLLTTAFFFQHRRNLALVQVLREARLYAALIFNWLMLAFGYAAERDTLRTDLALAFGGLAFVASFTFLCTFVDDSDSLSVGLFVFMYVVWALYGVAAACSYTTKNVAYNFLDLVSKNFYGLFLFVYALGALDR